MALAFLAVAIAYYYAPPPATQQPLPGPPAIVDGEGLVLLQPPQWSWFYAAHQAAAEDLVFGPPPVPAPPVSYYASALWSGGCGAAFQAFSSIASAAAQRDPAAAGLFRARYAYLFDSDCAWLRRASSPEADWYLAAYLPAAWALERGYRYPVALVYSTGGGVFAAAYDLSDPSSAEALARRLPRAVEGAAAGVLWLYALDHVEGAPKNYQLVGALFSVGRFYMVSPAGYLSPGALEELQRILASAGLPAASGPVLVVHVGGSAGAYSLAPGACSGCRELDYWGAVSLLAGLAQNR